jgi:hypothetical protein
MYHKQSVDCVYMHNNYDEWIITVFSFNLLVRLLACGTDQVFWEGIYTQRNNEIVTF